MCSINKTEFSPALSGETTPAASPGSAPAAPAPAAAPGRVRCSVRSRHLARCGAPCGPGTRPGAVLRAVPASGPVRCSVRSRQVQRAYRRRALRPSWREVWQQREARAPGAPSRRVWLGLWSRSEVEQASQVRDQGLHGARPARGPQLPAGPDTGSSADGHSRDSQERRVLWR